MSKKQNWETFKNLDEQKAEMFTIIVLPLIDMPKEAKLIFMSINKQ